jgi:hypothetical protein
MTPEDAKERYDLKDLPKSTLNATNDLLEESILNMAGNKQTTRSEVLVIEVWIKRHPDYKDGGLVTLVGDEVVQNIDFFPYEHGEYPIAKLDHIPTGKYYAESVVTDVIPLQRELNRTRSQLIENKNLTARPRYFAERGSMDVSKISGEPGQVITIMPGLQRPTPMEMPQMPQYVMQSLDQLQADMDDATGQHEISRGGTPNSQVTAATAISFLQEQDDSMLAMTVESQEKAIRKIGRQYLALAHQFWTQERTVKIVGEDGYFDAQVFMGSNIKGTKVNRDVRVESGSSLSYSKAAKQAIIMDLMKNALIDPQIGLSRMEFGGVDKLFEDIQLDRRQATRENLRIKQGEVISPNEFDNHDLHVELHNRYRKSQEYELCSDEVKMVFAAHVELHKQAIQAKMAQMNPLAGPPPVGNTGPSQPPQMPMGPQNG